MFVFSIRPGPTLLENTVSNPMEAFLAGFSGCLRNLLCVVLVKTIAA